MMQNKTSGWLELHDLSFHQQSEAVSPQDLYIEGYMEIENNFIPTTGIKGTAMAETPLEGTTPGWIQLNGLKFISDITAVAPLEPYIKGVQDGTGKFYAKEPYEIVGKLGT
jgi:hypothetical protein